MFYRSQSDLSIASMYISLNICCSQAGPLVGYFIGYYVLSLHLAGEFCMNNDECCMKND